MRKDLFTIIIRLIPISVAIAIVVFLNGGIMTIEKGTHEGGITGAAGVAAILIIGFSLSSLLVFIRKKHSTRKESKS